jgi:hypothetical protein
MSVDCRRPAEFPDLLRIGCRDERLTHSDGEVRFVYRQEPIFGQARKLVNALTTDIFDQCRSQDIVSARFHSGIGLCLGGFVIHANLGHVGHFFAGLQQ